MGINHSMVEQSGYLCMGYSRFLQIQTSTCLVMPAWSTQSIYGLTGAMLAAMIAAVSYECIDEYLRFLRRKALTRRNGAECCGAPVVTFGEKLGQSIIQVLRVSLAYFMMVCVMTMNVWLLVAVVIGAAVGYGVGKPLLANSIDDSVTSHGYTTASLKISSRRNNRSERSKSWRYQQVHRPDLIVQKRPIDDDAAFTDDLEDLNYSNTNTGTDVVWIRRSTEELRPNPRDLHDVFDDPEAQIRAPDDSCNVDSIRSEGRESSRLDCNRFRSTSKIINDSFRSYNSDSEMRKYSTSASTSANVSFESQTLDSIDNRKRSKRSGGGKVSRNASTASGGRFKPVSREINRQMSFNDDLR